MLAEIWLLPAPLEKRRKDLMNSENQSNDASRTSNVTKKFWKQYLRTKLNHTA
jgi:hypothetical protein